jgi:tetratricopeptide (TPR) repeat protein
MSRGWAGVILALGLSTQDSCGHESGCERHVQAQESKVLAKVAYDGGHFDQAKELYSNCVEWCTENYDARIGLANASRALGNQLYRDADVSAQQGKVQQAQKIFKQANENHVLADRLFRTALKERPDDLEPHYGLGLLWYERSTSPISAPWKPDDRENRQRERDESIKEFSIVLDRVPGSFQSHRYRGLARLAADLVEEGAADLRAYHNSRQDLYNKIVSTWSSGSDEEKRRKDIALRSVEKEIDDVREVLVLEQVEMVDRSRNLRKREPKDPAEAQKITQEIAHLSAVQLILEDIIKRFGLTKMGEIEQVVVKRCREYLESFNRGKLDEILPFLGARKGEEKQLRDSVTSKVDRGMQFKKVIFRTAAVSGESASIGFVCDLVTSQGSKPESEVTIRWRVVGGQWLVSDHP